MKHSSRDATINPTCENRVSHAVASPMPTARAVTLMTEFARDTAPSWVGPRCPQNNKLTVGSRAVLSEVSNCKYI